MNMREELEESSSFFVYFPITISKNEKFESEC